MCNYHISVRGTPDQLNEFAGLKIEFCGYVWSWTWLVSVAESLQYPPVWPQRDSGKACLRRESSEGIVWTILPCQDCASLMQVRRFQSAQLLCLDSLCSSSSMRKEYIQDLLGDTGWWKGRLCHESIIYLIRCFSGVLCIKCSLLSFFISSSVDCSRMSFLLCIREGIWWTQNSRNRRIGMGQYFPSTRNLFTLVWRYVTVLLCPTILCVSHNRNLNREKQTAGCVSVEPAGGVSTVSFFSLSPSISHSHWSLFQTLYFCGSCLGWWKTAIVSHEKCLLNYN